MSSSLTRRIIHTKSAPQPIGPYSQAVQIGSTLYISGAIGKDAQTGQLVSGISAETRQTLTNIGEVLRAANATFANVVKMTVLLADMNDFNEMNTVYASFFADTDRYPARVTYQVILDQCY
jgi:2-iminobutanoate/2-iminopropanoate deaminase